MGPGSGAPPGRNSNTHLHPAPKNVPSDQHATPDRPRELVVNKPAMRSYLPALLVVGCAAPPPAVTATASQPAGAVSISPPPPSVGPKVDQRAIVDLVRASSSAVLERKDVDDFLRPWAPDAVLVRSREESPSAYNVELDREQVRAVRRILIRDELPRTLEIENIDVHVDGSTATLRWRATTSAGNARDVFREEYKLRRTSGAWQITVMRYWPESRTVDGETAHFGPTWTRTIDREVDKARESGDSGQLLYKLFGAYRYREAYELAKQLTSQDDVDSWTWKMLRACALMVGDVTTAETADTRAAELEKQP